MSSFVIVYNRKSGDTAVTEFHGKNGHREALRRRLELEASRSNKDVEIVSLNSDSLETIKKTHARYFQKNLATA